MYTLTFSTYSDNDTVLHFDDCDEAVNAGVAMQLELGGYNSTDWEFKVERYDGKIVYDDFWNRAFEW